MQVPAESRIRIADLLRLLFHFFNIVNLTLGLIVFGIGVTLTTSPLPIDVSNEISLIYGTLLVAAVVVILMGIFGIHSCYWVQSNGLKLYAVLTCVGILLEVALGLMTILKKDEILGSLDRALETFKLSVDHENVTALSEDELITVRLEEYQINSTYKAEVDLVHRVMSCCSLLPNSSAEGANRAEDQDLQNLLHNITSCFNSNKLTLLPSCSQAFADYIDIRLLYITYLAFILAPVQMACLTFDLLVLKTLLVTKEYAKLERELSNKKKRSSHGYISISDIDQGSRTTKPI